MDECINLKARFGARWKVKYEESYAAERGERAYSADPWLMIVACQYGEIYPHGGEMLGVSTKRRGPITKRIAELPFIKITQDGDDGINAIFHVKNIEEVVAIVKPRRRRQYTPEQKQALAERGAAFRFLPLLNASLRPKQRPKQPNQCPTPPKTPTGDSRSP